MKNVEPRQGQEAMHKHFLPRAHKVVSDPQQWKIAVCYVHGQLQVIPNLHPAACNVPDLLDKGSLAEAVSPSLSLQS